MNLIQALAPAPDEEEIEYPKPGRSTILFELIEGETHLWTVWDQEKKVHRPAGYQIEEIQHEGGSAAIEAEEGMLEDSVYSLLDPDEMHPGWWVVEGFYGHFSKDYWGEVDCDFSCDDVRPARWSDMERFGICKEPWRAKVARWLRLPVFQRIPVDNSHPTGGNSAQPDCN